MFQFFHDFLYDAFTFVMTLLLIAFLTVMGIGLYLNNRLSK